MLLHRRRRLILESAADDAKSPYHQLCLEHPELTEIQATETEGLIDQPAFTISNMKIKVVIDHGIS